MVLGVAVDGDVAREQTGPEISLGITDGDGAPGPVPGVAGAGVLMVEDVAGGRCEKSGVGPAP